MRVHHRNNNINRTICAVTVVLSCSLGWDDARAGQSSPPIGGSLSGITRLMCGIGERVAGFQVEVEGGGAQLMTRIRARCREYGDDGAWAGSSSDFTSWSNLNRPWFFRSTKLIQGADCPTNQWVAAVRGDVASIGGVYGNYKYIKRLKVFCYEGTRSGTRVAHHKSSVIVGNKGGTSDGNRTCPGYELANGITLNSDDWFVTHLRLQCRGLEAPTILGPNEGVPSATAVNLRIQPRTDIDPDHLRVHVESGSDEMTLEIDYDSLQPSIDGPGLVSTIANEPGEWIYTVNSCDERGRCGESEVRRTVYVVPDPPALRSPAFNEILSFTNDVPFIWDSVEAANAGYDLYIFNANAVHEIEPQASDLPTNTNDVFWRPIYDPDPTQESIQETVDIPQQLGDELRWGVTSCINFDAIGRQCSLTFSSRPLALQ